MMDVIHHAQSASGQSITQPLLHEHRFMGAPRKFMKTVASVVVVAMLNVAGLPLSMAYQQTHLNAAQPPAQPMRTDAALAYANAVAALQSSALGSTKSQALPGSRGMSNAAHAVEKQANALRAEWQDLRTHWQTHGVDGEVLASQQALEQAFEREHTQLLNLLARGQGGRSSALSTFLASQAPKDTHVPVDLANLPWQVLKPQVRQPAATDAQLNALVSAAPPAGAQTSLKALKTTAAMPADLAATLDAPHTSDIRALADSLGRDAYRIYKWVYDHIRYVPTHGSVQGAQDTLEKKAGNAMDQASLLIALLRASGIAARYAYGTVEINASDAMNWVGGVKTTDALQQVLGQGGVPNTALISGGRVVAMRVEHVWVEAFIQYHPGRGTRHVAGVSTPDGWVPLDPSFKQNRFTAGMDVTRAVPWDDSALLQMSAQAQNQAATLGQVPPVNVQTLNDQVLAYERRVDAFIASQNGGQTTVGQLLGTRHIEPYVLPVLPNTLPYAVKARSRQFSEVPDALRTQFKYSIYADRRSASSEFAPLLTWQAPTAAIAGQALALVWVAASQADKAALAALMPKASNGQLPQSLPASIKLRPELRLNGQTVATGPAMTVGSEPVGVGGFTHYGRSQWDLTTEPLIAGQQTGLGVSVQGISAQQVARLRARIEATQTLLRQAAAVSDDELPTHLGNGQANQLTDWLTATLWGYFAALEAQADLASRQAGMVDLPGLSYGLLHAQVKPRKVLGNVTTAVMFQGLNMDIGHLRHLRWVKDDDPQSPVNQPAITGNGKTTAQNRWIAYNKQMGQYASGMEHFVPEAFWNDRATCRYEDAQGQVQNPTQVACVEGVSAVKAMAIAHAQGQRLYTINPDNRATALPQLRLTGDAGAEIIGAIQAGKEVSFHAARIDAHGWKGMGYSIIDPATGMGAYLLESNGNGGVMDKLSETFSNGSFVINAMMGLKDLCGLIERNMCRLVAEPESGANVGGKIIDALISLAFNEIDGAVDDAVKANACLTAAQAACISSGISALNSVRGVGGPTGIAGYLMGMTLLMFMTVHMIKTNHALGECAPRSS